MGAGPGEEGRELMKERILDGCYYPGCEHDHPEGKKFCGCDHKYLRRTPIGSTDAPEREFPESTNSLSGGREGVQTPEREFPESTNSLSGDDDWMDDPAEQESWIAGRIKNLS